MNYQIPAAVVRAAREIAESGDTARWRFDCVRLDLPRSDGPAVRWTATNGRSLAVYEHEAPDLAERLRELGGGPVLIHRTALVKLPLGAKARREVVALEAASVSIASAANGSASPSTVTLPRLDGKFPPVERVLGRDQGPNVCRVTVEINPAVFAAALASVEPREDELRDGKTEVVEIGLYVPVGDDETRIERQIEFSGAAGSVAVCMPIRDPEAEARAAAHESEGDA